MNYSSLDTYSLCTIPTHTIFFPINDCNSFVEHFTSITSKPKTLVLYVFHQYNDRVAYFITHGIFESPTVDFLFICNDRTFPLQDHVPSYVKTMTRDNIGYDFGGWSDALLLYGYSKQPYDYYLFVNSSVYGPFMKNHPNILWTDVFIDGLQHDDITLFGVTINSAVFTGPKPITDAHVQSYVFCVRKQTLLELIEDGIFTIDYSKTFHDTIVKQEVGLSRAIIRRNGNIGCTHTYYKGIDWRFTTKQPEDYPITFLGDIMFGLYCPTLWNQDELVFVKGNRDITCIQK